MPAVGAVAVGTILLKAVLREKAAVCYSLQVALVAYNSSVFAGQDCRACSSMLEAAASLGVILSHHILPHHAAPSTAVKAVCHGCQKQ